jgi:hypothetical protein
MVSTITRTPLSIFFKNATSRDLPQIAQKGYNVAKLYQDTGEIVARLGIQSSVPLIGINGSILIAQAYRDHLETNQLIRPITTLLNQFNRGSITQDEMSSQAQSLIIQPGLSQRVQAELVSIRNMLIHEYGQEISLFTRSTATLREDVEGVNIDELRSMVGAGKHDSYDENYSESELFASVLKTWASMFSFQATGDYLGLGDPDNWLHLQADMPVIVMPQVLTSEGGSAIGFSDPSGAIANVSYASNAKGETLVGGADAGTSIDATGDKILFKSGEVNLPDDAILALSSFILHLHALKGHPQDTEWACGTLTNGGNQILVPVQFRTNGPLFADMISDEVQIHEVNSLPDVDFSMSGITVGKKCGVGTTATLVTEADVKSCVDVSGKILIATEAWTSLPGLFSRGPSAIIAQNGNTKCHFGIMAKGKGIPAGVSFDGDYVEGGVYTLLHDKLYPGNHRNRYDILDVDLRGAILESNSKTRIKGVFGDLGDLGTLHNYLRLGIFHGITLFRQEEIGWSGDIPSPLSFVYYDQIDTDNPMGLLVKDKIKSIMEGFNTSDPIEAYVLATAGKAMQVFQICKSFNAPCSMRTYGGRLDEDKSYLLPGTLPKNCTPHEVNPYLGFNGVSMYLEDWGKPVFEMSIQVLKLLREWGYETDLFLPNVASPQGLEKCLTIAQNQGLVLSDWDLKPMIENDMAAFHISDFHSLGSKKIGIGLNDLSYACGGDVRNLKFADNRGDFSSRYWQNKVRNICEAGSSLGMIVESCGAAEGAVQALVEGGCNYIGSPVGSDVIELAEQIRQYRG